MNSETILATCDVTGTEVPENELIETACGKRICQQEFDANWGTCEDSDEIVPLTDLFEVRNDRNVRRHVCGRVFRSDYVECIWSADYFLRGDTVRVTNYGRVAEYHRENSGSFFTCDCCGEVYHEDDYGSDGHCTGCERDENGPIQDYSSRDYPAPKGAGPLRYGVELEVEVKRGAGRAEEAQEALDLLGEDFVIMKDDGSLEHGFEIVTCPASLEEQRKGWARFIAGRSSMLRAWDTKTCGMHVHVSRAALSQLQIGKLLVFVNAPMNKKFVEDCAGRAESSWSQFREKKLTDGRKQPTARYEAINLVPRNTIEFRIFKSTMNPVRFFANLEFVDALVKFTAPAARSIAESADVASFVRFVRSHRKAWPKLHERLVVLNYLPALPVRPAPAAPATNNAPAVTE